MSLSASLLLAMEVQDKISKKYTGCKATFSNVMAKEIITGLKNRTYDLALRDIHTCISCSSDS